MKTLFKGGDTGHTLQILHQFYNALAHKAGENNVRLILSTHAIIIKVGRQTAVSAVQNFHESNEWTMEYDDRMIHTGSTHHEVNVPKPILQPSKTPQAIDLEPQRHRVPAPDGSKEPKIHDSAWSNFWRGLIPDLSIPDLNLDIL